MTVLYNLNSISVSKLEDNTYSITNDSDILSFFSLLKFPYTEEKEHVDIIYFKAQSVQTLSQYMKKEEVFDYQTILSMLYTLGNQLLYLEKQNKGIPFFALEDILIINDNTFLFINIDKILPIENKELILNYPLSLKSLFIAPELNKDLTIPLKLYYTCSYYSLGLLFMYCLYGTDYNNYLTDIKNNDFEKILNPIFSTKLYYFLKRCLEKDPRKRYFIYI
jgi:hypothetical protein